MTTPNQTPRNSEFGTIPAVRLNTLMPRRLFVPLELVRGKNVSELCRRIKAGESFTVY